MKKLLLRDGTLLGISAILSKCFALWRDRLFVEIFGAGELVDLIFASFRVPDFFFFLLVGATVSAIILPRISHLDKQKEKEFFSSFLWGVAVFFGLLSGAGILGAEFLIPLFASGFSAELQDQMVPLVQLLFGSVFILSVSAIFSAFLQHRHQFFSIAVAPVFYTGGVCAGLIFWQNQFGIAGVGFSAIFGSILHFFITVFNFFRIGGTFGLFWKKPAEAWQNFTGDFTRRVLSNAAFQINQTADVIIASFLLTGSVAAFSLGSNLGHFLLSIVGYSVANSAFPRMAKAKHDHEKQKAILLSSTKWILFFCVPASVICAFFASEILQLIFNLSGPMLEKTKTVFFWTVISLPAACLIPILSRFFLANDDTRTPLAINAFSLFCATVLAAVLSLVILPREMAILGLAWGNFTANFLSAGIFTIAVMRRLKGQKH